MQKTLLKVMRLLMLALKDRKMLVVKLLLDHSDSKNIDFIAKNKDGYIGIMFACEDGDQDVVKLLLKIV